MEATTKGVRHGSLVGMRLGLLGPARAQQIALENAARFLLRERKVDRAVYLDVDQALDEVVHRWAERLVSGNPAEGAIWERATERCLRAGPATIDEFIVAERQRLGLRVLESPAYPQPIAVTAATRIVVPVITPMAPVELSSVSATDSAIDGIMASAALSSDASTTNTTMVYAM